MSNKLTNLRQFIITHYDLTELQTLCFDLGVNYDDLGESKISVKTQELILLLGRQRRLDVLLTALQNGRPQAFHQTGFKNNSQTLDLLYAGLPVFQVNNEPALPRPHNEKILLEKTQAFWIEGVLEKSLHHDTLLELAKEVDPKAVDYPWEMIVQSPDQERYTLTSDKHIVEVFDESHQLMLILGAPGSGKTTILLELARRTIDRARENPRLPVPVVFNLSSWQDESLDRWLVKELNEKYLIPQKIGRSWIDENRLLLLLDGLDEVLVENQISCVETINHFLQEHLTGIVVCSRLAEYDAINHKLKLNRAIILKPLSTEQIANFLTTGESQWQKFAIDLQADPILQEMAQLPLTLNILLLTYQSNPQLPSHNSPEEYYQDLYTTYVQQMLKRRRKKDDYTPEQIIHWLSWLAQQMKQHGQTIFLIERLQPGFLQRGKQRLIYAGFGVLLGTVMGGGGGTLIGWLNGGLNLEKLWGITWSLVGGLLGLLLSTRNITLLEGPRWSRKILISTILGVLIGSLYGWLGARLSESGFSFRALGVAPDPKYFFPSGIAWGLIIGLFNGLRNSKLQESTLPNQGIRETARLALIASLIGGIAGAWMGWPFPNNMVIQGFIVAVSAGLILGGISIVQHYTLRFILHLNNCMPLDYIAFLDRTSERLFLRRVGGGYIFIHRLLLEYFAGLEAEENS